jgi:hypothetical protein
MPTLMPLPWHTYPHEADGTLRASTQTAIHGSNSRQKILRHKQRTFPMFRTLSTLHPNVVRAMIAVGALAMFVLSAGAPLGYGG